jgi:2-oxoglutarate dehydrogenase E2 component (dihydrolipoamide succinyltransferase)
MLIEIRVPPLGESITDATVGNWLKQPGESVAEGDVLAELETDKVMLEVPAAEAGVLKEIVQASGAIVHAGDVLARIDTGVGVAKAAAAAPRVAPAPAAAPAKPAAAPQPAARAAVAASAPVPPPMPAAQRMIAEVGVEAAAIAGSGRHGQVTKGDVIDFMERAPQRISAAGGAGQATAAAPRPAPAATPGARETRVKMSRLRQRIAERLVQAQQTAAILTTFNEVDMSAVLELRAKYKESFQAKYGIGLGFMSFFTKASIDALRAFPAVNGEIQGDEIVYKNYYDIGVAVGTERGLVVPVVRDADRKRFIEIEQELADLGKRAREGKLSVEELTGGTFTISNGGVYGSMLSTPILNPPQSAILGMHNITKRAVVINDQVAVRPMMYLALSYDHRIIDGREAVQFLVRVKQAIEDPARMLLEI